MFTSLFYYAVVLIPSSVLLREMSEYITLLYFRNGARSEDIPHEEKVYGVK